MPTVSVKITIIHFNCPLLSRNLRREEKKSIHFPLHRKEKSQPLSPPLHTTKQATRKPAINRAISLHPCRWSNKRSSWRSQSKLQGTTPSSSLLLLAQNIL
mmetsp:Transcript_5353/g.8137  ORF Transcript_5353/g.8137 Transcript_5353/m.8137 type:complete len:101 (+) Transcript_5353:56-358(+)